MSNVVAFRRFEDDQATSSKDIHTPSDGNEIYAGQGIEAEIRTPQGRVGVFQVYRISPLGAEIDITESAGKIDLIVGSDIDLNITIGKQICEFHGLVVANRYRSNGREILGVRWVEEFSTTEFQNDRRKNTRWLCGEDFMPNGIAPNPAKFNDFIYFKVVDVSSEGLQLATSLRNKLLIPGMILEASISFPLVGEIRAPVKILNVRIRSIGNKEVLALGVKLIDTNRTVLETLGQYCLQFGPPTTVSDLKTSGLKVQSTERALEFGFVKTKEDYLEVLALRKRAYSDAGKTQNLTDAEDMGDIYDTKSRIITAKHKSKLVGSARITFHSNEDQTEYEQFLKLPSDIPRKTEMLVASRVCTSKEYRGSDLVYGLIRQIYLAAIQANRKYILGGSTDSLLPFYEKLGFRGTGAYFQHGSLNSVREQLLIADVVKVLMGESCSLRTWSKHFSDLSDYVTNYHDIDATPLGNARLSIYKMISKVI